MADGELVVHRKPTGCRVELVLNGLAVSWVELLYRRLRIGRAELSFGGLADVFTRREHRHKGLSRRVLEHALKTMTADGLDVSMLFGIPNYYHKFGFRTTLSDYRVDLPGRAALPLPVELAVREIPKSRHADVLPLHQAELRRSNFGTVRRRGTWSGYHRGAMFRNEARVAGFYRGRRLVAYAVYDQSDKECRSPEIAVTDETTARTVLAWLARLCRRHVCETISIHLPPDHPASRAAIELGATFIRQTAANAGGMMRVLNLGSTVAALMPELAARWAASPLGESGLDLTLATELGSAELTIPARSRAAGVVRGRVRVPQNRLIQLATGYLGSAAMAARSDVHIPRNLLPPMNVLFPERQPTILATDCF
jgi:predicted acetyltransferase